MGAYIPSGPSFIAGGFFRKSMTVGQDQAELD